MNALRYRQPACFAMGTSSLLRWSKLRRGLLFALLLFALGTTSSPAQEFRAAWVDIFHNGMGSASEVDTLVSTLASGNYNAVIVQVLGYMDMIGTASHGAHWQSSILPWSPRVKANFDPLAYLCTQAHAAGIEVHAWIGGSGGAMYRVSLEANGWPPKNNATLAAHPEWFIAPRANSEGNAVVAVDIYYSLDMGSPDVQEYLVSIVRELVTNYPIDGINWDDEINGDGYLAGFGYPAYSQANYARSGLARYRLNTGATGTPSNTDPAWSNYRRRFKNELMARVQAEIQSIKSNPRQPVRHTTAALAYGSPPGNCNFATSTPYLYFCDWAGMLQNGWVDAVIPQTYSKSTFKSWADRISSCWVSVRPVFMGMSFSGLSISDITSQISYLRDKGLTGYATYSYYTAPANWWSHAAANVNTSTSGTPIMPWRNPATATEGMMWGRVKDGATGLYVDDATVTVAGRPPVKTDGNGYYVATLIPATAAGTAYEVTATKDGLGAHTIANATVLAGDVVRYDFTLVVPPASPVLVWGDNTFGQSAAPELATNAIAVAAGAWHTLALRADGRVVAWGDNSSGQCGDGEPMTNALAIAAGGYHNLAIRRDGAVVAWGANDYGQASVPPGLSDVIAVAAGTWHSVALRANGTVVVWGDDSFGQKSQQPAGLTQVVAVAAGGNHTLALKANGRVVAWGENTDAEGNVVGQSEVPWDLADVVAIGAGGYHSLAVKADGRVVGWGDNSQGQVSVPAGLGNVVAVAGGGMHSVALCADGSVVAWGANWSGQSGIPAWLPAAVGISAGEWHTVGLLEGTLPEARLHCPARKGNRFRVLAQTVNRKTYVLERLDSLGETNWVGVSTNAGNGALRMLTDPAATAPQRFYRMKQW